MFKMKAISKDELERIEGAVKYGALDEAEAQELLKDPDRARQVLFALEARESEEYERQKEENIDGDD